MNKSSLISKGFFKMTGQKTYILCYSWCQSVLDSAYINILFAHGSNKYAGKARKNVSRKYIEYPIYSAPKPLAQPAKDLLKAKMDESNAYSVAECCLFTMAIKKARNAAVPRPPVNDSIALAPYISNLFSNAMGVPA